MPEPITVHAPAKINLHLAVGDRRADGFHDLVTVFHAIGLYDEVTATPAHTLSLEVTGEGATALPTGDDNLAVRAARALAAYVDVEPAVQLRLSKRIPVAAGLAGGSADAAATLVACDELWRTKLDRSELLELAAGLGSDVSFALAGGTALGTGRGERLTSVLAAGGWNWVLALAASGLSTPAVYKELDRLRDRGRIKRAGDADDVINALRTRDPDRLGAALANDLQVSAVSLRPELAATLRQGLELGGLGGIVSGSGPTCVFLARSREGAVKLAAALSAAGVCRTVKVAAGPVPGASVVTSE
ncbi:MAG: 4-(cytidine 5'-diphospho)-2-C-methyl-D-erythritol kinase [Mycobacteriales bacterium]